MDRKSVVEEQLTFWWMYSMMQGVTANRITFACLLASGRTRATLHECKVPFSTLEFNFSMPVSWLDDGGGRVMMIEAIIGEDAYQLHKIAIATTEMIRSTVSMMVSIIVYNHQRGDWLVRNPYRYRLFPFPGGDHMPPLEASMDKKSVSIILELVGTFSRFYCSLHAKEHAPNGFFWVLSLYSSLVQVAWLVETNAAHPSGNACCNGSDIVGFLLRYSYVECMYWVGTHVHVRLLAWGRVLRMCHWEAGVEVMLMRSLYCRVCVEFTTACPADCTGMSRELPIVNRDSTKLQCHCSQIIKKLSYKLPISRFTTGFTQTQTLNWNFSLSEFSVRGTAYEKFCISITEHIDAANFERVTTSFPFIVITDSFSLTIIIIITSVWPRRPVVDNDY